MIDTNTGDQWQNDFRMSRASFDSLCDKLRKQLQRDACVREVVTVELQVIVLLRLGDRTIGNLFGIAKSTVCVLVKRFALQLMTSSEIYWK